MNKLSIVLLLAAALSSCKDKIDFEEGTPKCIQDRIKAINKASICPDPKVYEYVFQGATVYAMYMGSCGADMSTEVIDSDCKTIGSLGGFSGVTKINGEEFSNAKFVKTVWEK
jgi:hypothetical protein